MKIGKHQDKVNYQKIKDSLKQELKTERTNPIDTGT